MNICIYYEKEISQDWVFVEGFNDSFSVWPEADDYVEETSLLMQQTADNLFQYPFFIHFEGYDDDIDEVCAKISRYDAIYQDSGRKVLTMHTRKTYHAEVPSFPIKITNRETLENVFSEWFYLARENMMWLITQKQKICYQDGFACVDAAAEPVILLADHDAQGFTLMSSRSCLQTKADIIRLMDNGDNDFIDHVGKPL